MPDPVTAVGPHWVDYVGLLTLILLFLAVVGVGLNLNKLLSRTNSIRRQLREASDTGSGAHLVEAIAQLQSVAVSLDRIAERCDAMDAKLAEVVQRGPGGEGSLLETTMTTLREGLAELGEPLAQIRDAVQRSKIERLADEVRRILFGEGYDRVDITTDLSSLEGNDGKVQVEVQREGVKAKGYVVLKDGSVVERKISATYEMFP